MPPETSRRYRQLTLLFWLVLAAEAAAAMLVAHPWLTADSRVYLGLADSIRHGFYGLTTAVGPQPDTLRPPGYPMLLALLFALGLPVLAIVILQLLAVLLAIHLIDRRLSGPVRSWFRGLILIYPFTLLYCSMVMAEPLALLCVTVVAMIFSKEGVRLRGCILAGALMGFAALLRSDLLLLPIAVAIGLAWTALARRSFSKQTVVATVTPIIVAGLMLTPYAMWNSRTFNEFSPVPAANAVGSSLYLTTWEGMVPLADLNALYDGIATPAAQQAGLSGDVERLNRSFGAPPLTSPFNPAGYATAEMQIAAPRVFGRAAMTRIAADPARYAWHVTRSIWRLWNTGEYPPSVPRSIVSLLRIVSTIVWATGIVGACAAVLGERQLAKWRVAAVVMLYPLAIHMWMHTEARYTAVARPLLVMFAAFVLWRLFVHVRDRFAQQSQFSPA